MKNFGEGACKVLEDGNWFLWNWDDPPNTHLYMPFSIFHKCDTMTEESHQTERNGFDKPFKCNVCGETPPNGMSAVCEMMNWKKRNS